ncbi:MAG: DUF1015 domain-containing protein [Planctomycetales bacterium]|nr:DUF1015 domain-containing protein [Planctomycetales bacterium]
MPDIQAFRGVRYDLAHVGALSDVIAPPYDVISPELQEELYKRHPANVIRLILNRDEPGDDENAKYDRASRFLRSWQREGVLMEEAAPALYVYHQEFETGGEKFIRKGFMCRVRLEPFGEGKIYPHEETHAAAKADRLKLINACGANLSQIFGLYPDEDNQVQQRLEDAIIEVAPLEAVDHLGVVHRIWPVTDLAVITDVCALIADKPMFVADGHHRYETACNYRAQQGEIDSENPANFVLTMCVGMNDPGMIVLPTHRLFRGMPSMTAEQLIEKIGGCFDAKVAGEGADLAETIWSTIENADRQENLALYTAADERWVTATLNAAGRQRMAEVAATQSGDWQGLGVAILHRLLVETLLGATELPKPKYVHLVEELVDALHGDDSCEFQLAALVMPATLDHIRAISEHGERMPAKSTYFYPKLLSGLVFNRVR